MLIVKEWKFVFPGFGVINLQYLFNLCAVLDRSEGDSNPCCSTAGKAVQYTWAKEEDHSADSGWGETENPLFSFLQGL